MSAEKCDPVSVALDRFQVAEAICDDFPEATVAVIVALGLRNTASTQESLDALADACASVRGKVDADSLKDHPKIACWHDIYKRFNAKPKKYPSSVESLARRALRPDTEVPGINALVDFYNALSLRHLVPIGGEDLDTLAGKLELRPSTGNDHFDIADDSAASEVIVPAGEIVWADDVGVTCRRWNWRQGRRTRLTEETTNAWFIIDSAVSSTGGREISEIVSELCGILRNEARATHVGYRLIKVGESVS
jgi:DNA/RNA-binding domain of Phe-tRNA-synthetase-like protein